MTKDDLTYLTSAFMVTMRDRDGWEVAVLGRDYTAVCIEPCHSRDEALRMFRAVCARLTDIDWHGFFFGRPTK